MKSNLRIKRSLIIQSFAPLFLLLMIKHWNLCLYVTLIKKFLCEITQSIYSALDKTIHHAEFGNFFVFTLGVVWVVIAISIALGFRGIHSSGFTSAGEKIIVADTETEGSAVFLVTYVLPLFTDDVSTWNRLIVFLLMLIMVIVLLNNSKNFYQNPILTILKYKTYSFKFLNPETDIENPESEYICITRGKGISEEATIKRKYIADGVFLIYND